MWQKIKNYYHLVQAFGVALFFGFPSKKLIVIGVTGTDGKTTTVAMISHILKAAGKKTSYINSVSAQIANKKYNTGFHVSTPSPFQVQKYLKKAQDAASEYFVLEATSHGLDQNRLAFVDFKIAVLTNITYEHLDYHKTWNEYANSKSKLFKNVQTSILNLDDKSYKILKDKIKGRILTYSQNKKADLNLDNCKIKLKIEGDYNLSNALAAAAAATNLGIPKKTILKALANFNGVLGRMENIDLGQNFKVFIDFAHTPNGLEQALKTLNSKLRIPNSRLIAVFGSAGERDKAKRQMMGKVADRWADLIILTSEDPRSEDAKNICKEIKRGIKSKKFHIIVDRREAINFAMSKAKDNDIVGVFGKAHETSMNIGGKELPWDEFEAVRQAIKRKVK